MKRTEERPNLGRTNLPRLEVSNDFLKLSAVAHDILRDEAFCRKSLLELRTVTGGAGAIEKSHEVLEQCVGTAQCYEQEAIIALRKAVGAIEVVPVVANCLSALVVRGADGEAALDLANEFLK